MDTKRQAKRLLARAGILSLDWSVFAGCWRAAACCSRCKCYPGLQASRASDEACSRVMHFSPYSIIEAVGVIDTLVVSNCHKNIHKFINYATDVVVNIDLHDDRDRDEDGKIKCNTWAKYFADPDNQYLHLTPMFNPFNQSPEHFLHRRYRMCFICRSIPSTPASKDRLFYEFVLALSLRSKKTIYSGLNSLILRKAVLNIGNGS